MLLAGVEQWAAFPDTPEGAFLQGRRASWEEVTLGEWCFFGFSESCENVALSGKLKKKSMPPPTNDTVSQAMEPQLVDK